MARYEAGVVLGVAISAFGLLLTLIDGCAANFGMSGQTVCTSLTGNLELDATVILGLIASEILISLLSSIGYFRTKKHVQMADSPQEVKPN